MSLLGCLLLGKEGVYKVFDTTLKFQNAPNPLIHWGNNQDTDEKIKNVVSLQGAGIFSTLAQRCLNSSFFWYATQGRLRQGIHEMGHVSMQKLLFSHTKTNPVAVIFFDSKTATTYYIPRDDKEPDWKELYNLDDVVRAEFEKEGIMKSDWRYTVMGVAGPMANIAFSNVEIVAAIALRNYISWPVAAIRGVGAFTWIAGELLYAYSSACKKDGGDFGSIARDGGKVHLSCAAAALIGQVALGAMAAYYAI